MPKFQENIPLAQWSNYKIGGPARFFFEPESEDELREAVEEAKALSLRVFVLGGGTNLLIDDEGFDGLVIHPKLMKLEASGAAVTAGAGVMMSDLLQFAAGRSLKGLEWAGGLPGTLGGAIRGNAGCFGGEIKDAVATVKSLDTETMKIIERPVGECGFDYRTSAYKKANGREIVLEATLALAKGEKEEILAAIAEKIAHRVKHHPLEHPNIGSMFKNVPLATIHKEGCAEYRTALAAASLDYCGSRFSIKTDPFPVISAAKLIGETGLRGVSYGGAMISAKHPNFIVNVLGAKAEDVKGLMELVKAGVRDKFEVQLEEEVQLI